MRLLGIRSDFQKEGKSGILYLMNTLLLTSDEKKVFDALPASLKEGWQVEEEKIFFEDSLESRNARFSLMRLHDPMLLKFRENAERATSEEEVVKMMQEMDLRSVADDDLSELFFALGPTILTGLVDAMLGAVKTDKDLADIDALLVIRHSLLEASQNI